MNVKVGDRVRIPYRKERGLGLFGKHTGRPELTGTVYAVRGKRVFVQTDQKQFMGQDIWAGKKKELEVIS